MISFLIIAAIFVFLTLYILNIIGAIGGYFKDKEFYKFLEEQKKKHASN